MLKRSIPSLGASPDPLDHLSRCARVFKCLFPASTLFLYPTWEEHFILSPFRFLLTMGMCTNHQVLLWKQMLESPPCLNCLLFDCFRAKYLGLVEPGRADTSHLPLAA